MTKQRQRTSAGSRSQVARTARKTIKGKEHYPDEPPPATDPREDDTLFPIDSSSVGNRESTTKQGRRKSNGGQRSHIHRGSSKDHDNEDDEDDDGGDDDDSDVRSDAALNAMKRAKRSTKRSTTGNREANSEGAAQGDTMSTPNVLETFSYDSTPHAHTVTRGGDDHYRDTTTVSAQVCALCEFVDNSIMAMRRQGEAQSEQQPRIEVLITPKGPKTTSAIWIVDNGKGMTRDGLIEFTKYHNSLDQRLTPHQLREMCPDPDRFGHFVNSRISFFGVGAKHAGFFLSKKMTVYSKRADAPHVTSTTMDSNAMETRERAQSGDVFRGNTIAYADAQELAVEKKFPSVSSIVGPDVIETSASFTCIKLETLTDQARESICTTPQLLASQLGNVYHYYVNGTNLQYFMDEKNRFTTVDIVVIDQKRKLEFTLDDTNCYEQRCLTTAQEHFQFHASVPQKEGVALDVEVDLRYHPYFAGKETRPKRQWSYNPEEETDSDEALTTAIFNVYWNGRLIPGTTIKSFPFCSEFVSNGQKRTPVIGTSIENYKRITGSIFVTNPPVKVDQSKTSVTSDIAALLKWNPAKIHFRDNKGRTVSGKSFDFSKYGWTEFHEWLKRAAKLDEDIGFFGLFKDNASNITKIPGTTMDARVFTGLFCKQKPYQRNFVKHSARNVPTSVGQIKRFYVDNTNLDSYMKKHDPNSSPPTWFLLPKGAKAYMEVIEKSPLPRSERVTSSIYEIRHFLTPGMTPTEINKAQYAREFEKLQRSLPNKIILEFPFHKDSTTGEVYGGHAVHIGEEIPLNSMLGAFAVMAKHANGSWVQFQKHSSEYKATMTIHQPKEKPKHYETKMAYEAKDSCTSAPNFFFTPVNCNVPGKYEFVFRLYRKQPFFKHDKRLTAALKGCITNTKSSSASAYEEVCAENIPFTVSTGRPSFLQALVCTTADSIDVTESFCLHLRLFDDEENPIPWQKYVSEKRQSNSSSAFFPSHPHARAVDPKFDLVFTQLKGRRDVECAISEKKPHFATLEDEFTLGVEYANLSLAPGGATSLSPFIKFHADSTSARVLQPLKLFLVAGKPHKIVRVVEEEQELVLRNLHSVPEFRLRVVDKLGNICKPKANTSLWAYLMSDEAFVPFFVYRCNFDGSADPSSTSDMFHYQERLSRPKQLPIVISLLDPSWKLQTKIDAEELKKVSQKHRLKGVCTIRMSPRVLPFEGPYSVKLECSTTTFEFSPHESGSMEVLSLEGLPGAQVNLTCTVHNEKGDELPLSSLGQGSSVRVDNLEEMPLARSIQGLRFPQRSGHPDKHTITFGFLPGLLSIELFCLAGNPKVIDIMTTEDSAPIMRSKATKHSTTKTKKRCLFMHVTDEYGNTIKPDLEKHSLSFVLEREASSRHSDHEPVPDEEIDMSRVKVMEPETESIAKQGFFALDGIVFNCRPGEYRLKALFGGAVSSVRKISIVPGPFERLRLTLADQAYEGVTTIPVHKDREYPLKLEFLDKDGYRWDEEGSYEARIKRKSNARKRGALGRESLERGVALFSNIQFPGEVGDTVDIVVEVLQAKDPRPGTKVIVKQPKFDMQYHVRANLNTPTSLCIGTKMADEISNVTITAGDQLPQFAVRFRNGRGDIIDNLESVIHPPIAYLDRAPNRGISGRLDENKSAFVVSISDLFEKATSRPSGVRFKQKAPRGGASLEAHISVTVLAGSPERLDSSRSDLRTVLPLGHQTTCPDGGIDLLNGEAKFCVTDKYKNVADGGNCSGTVSFCVKDGDTADNQELSQFRIEPQTVPIRASAAIFNSLKLLWSGDLTHPALYLCATARLDGDVTLAPLHIRISFVETAREAQQIIDLERRKLDEAENLRKSNEQVEDCKQKLEAIRERREDLDDELVKLPPEHRVSRDDPQFMSKLQQSQHKLEDELQREVLQESEGRYRGDERVDGMLHEFIAFVHYPSHPDFDRMRTIVSYHLRDYLDAVICVDENAARRLHKHNRVLLMNKQRATSLKNWYRKHRIQYPGTREGCYHLQDLVVVHETSRHAKALKALLAQLIGGVYVFPTLQDAIQSDVSYTCAYTLDDLSIVGAGGLFGDVERDTRRVIVLPSGACKVRVERGRDWDGHSSKTKANEIRELLDAIGHIRHVYRLVEQDNEEEQEILSQRERAVLEVSRTNEAIAEINEDLDNLRASN